MKKQTIIVLLLLVGLVAPAVAQTKDKRVEDRVQLARDRYAEGLEAIATIKEYERDDIPAVNYTTVVRKQNWAGSGMTTDKMEFYYNEIEDDMEPYPTGYAILMVRRTYNVGSTEFFEEYVYDADGNPLFWFTRYGYYEGKSYSYKVELRGYFDADGTLIRTICKKAGENEELQSCSTSDRVNNYDEEPLEAAFTRAQQRFQVLKTTFEALYDMDYTY